MPLPRRVSAQSLGRLCALGLPLVISACGHKASGSGEPGPASGSAASAAPATPLAMDDLAGVCGGKGEPRAKPYTKAGAAAHAMIAFERGAEKPTFELHVPEDLTDFRPERAEEVELVACVVRTAQHKIETCDFDSTPPVRHLDMNDASYEITLREATTAAVVTTKTVGLPAERCPRFHSFKSEREPQFPSSDPAVTEIAKTFVLPAAGGIGLKMPNPDAGVLKLEPDALDKVCYGLPETRAAAYEKAPGKLSPTLLFSRVNDNARFVSSLHPEIEVWRSEVAQRYQLVLCATEKSRTKKKDCKFDDKEPVHFLDMYSATYDVALREAKTAKVLATTTVTEEALTSCPTMWLFKSTHDTDIPGAEKAIVVFADPFARPK